MSTHKTVKYYIRDNQAYKIIHKNQSEWIERVGLFHSHNVKIKKKICPLIYQTVFNTNYGRSTENKIDTAIREYFGSDLV